MARETPRYGHGRSTVPRSVLAWPVCSQPAWCFGFEPLPSALPPAPTSSARGRQQTHAAADSQYRTCHLASRNLHFMPWCVEERTRLISPQHGLNWRHLKASTESASKRPRNSSATPPPRPLRRRRLELPQDVALSCDGVLRHPRSFPPGNSGLLISLSATPCLNCRHGSARSDPAGTWGGTSGGCSVSLPPQPRSSKASACRRQPPAGMRKDATVACGQCLILT